MSDIIAKLVFVMVVVAWYFYVRRAAYWFMSQVDKGHKPDLFETVISYAIAIPLTGLSVGAAFGALAVARWVFS